MREPIADFPRLEPLFWRVLGVLARHGFVAPPSDARDVIQDFYVDAWSGVSERFDADRSSFSAYVASAFYKFARRRIVALGGLRHRLVDIEAIASHASADPTPLQALEHRQSIASLRNAVARLPAIERLILQDYLDEPLGGERGVASRHSLSRYALRERLLSAVGRLAVELGQVDARNRDSLVAFYLWHDGRSPKNVSSLLGISISDVHFLKAQFAASLLSTIRSYESVHRQGRSSMPRPPFEELKLALFEPGNEAALELVKQNSQAIRESLSTEDGDLELTDDEDAFLSRNSRWVSKVYEAIGLTPEDLDSDLDSDEEIDAALESMHESEAVEIGEAFRMLVTDMLPGEFKRWEAWFEHLEPVSLERQLYLGRDPSTLAAGAVVDVLHIYGLTPMMFFEATRGLELLFDRMLYAPDDQSSAYSEGADSPWPQISIRDKHSQLDVSPTTVVAQISTTPGLRADGREALAKWVVGALDHCPTLVRGYRSHSFKRGMLLQQTQGPQYRAGIKADVYGQWAGQFA